MPSLGDLECHLELEPPGIKFSEYRAQYLNSAVETYVAIPEHPTAFSIVLDVLGYISPGLSVYVFIDGVFQVCKNKSTGSRCAKKTTQFRFNQKEQHISKDRVIARDWRFEKFNIGTVKHHSAYILHPT
jgi:hypothetical protein